MNTQDLKRLAEAAHPEIHGYTGEWFTGGALHLNFGLSKENAAYIAAMSPDIALQLLAERAMLLEALKDAKEKLEWFVDSYPQDVASSRYDFFATIRAAIEQCEQGTQP